MWQFFGIFCAFKEGTIFNFIKIIFLSFGFLICACSSTEATTLKILTHDSFDAKQELIDEFTKTHNINVQIIKAGDANQVLTRARLNAGNPEADLIFGIDNIAYIGITEIDKLLIPYESQNRKSIPPDILDAFSNSTYFTPIDYGYVSLNYDPKFDDQLPPSDLMELTTNRWKNKMIVLDPATSSPGLQFLLTTISYFGKDNWQNFWRQLKNNNPLLVDGWSTGYYTHFSHNGGDRPLIISYTTSPAAEAFFNNLTTTPTQNVVLNDLFRQVESIAILEGAKNIDASKKFVDFMLSEKFQEQIPETMFVYPVIEALDLPEWWNLNPQITSVNTINFSNDELQNWISEWSTIMR
tara:strand:- start:19829 stop:20887 length:1059 start_codon:yes stop_codon:yes gene_type:complete